VPITRSTTPLLGVFAALFACDDRLSSRTDPDLLPSDSAASCTEVVTDYTVWGSEGQVATDWRIRQTFDRAGASLSEFTEDRLHARNSFGSRWTYDAAERPVEVAWLGAAHQVIESGAWIYEDDASGQLQGLSYSDEDGTSYYTTYLYDGSGRVVQESSDGLQEEGRDGIVDQVVDLTYDAEGWLASRVHWAPEYPESVLVQSYQAQGLLVREESLENGESDVLQTWDYDDHGNVTRYVTTFSGLSSTVLASHWTYDENGRAVSSESDQGDDGSVESRTTFQYDATGALIRQELDSPVDGVLDASWDYARSPIACP
jgi:hypothetical protein